MKHFTIQELSTTNTGLQNIPSITEQKNLRKLVENVLDPLRELYGKPIHVNSGYRSPLVNRKVNGAVNSDHVKGMAADITAGSREENKKLYELIRDNFTFRQLINEHDYKWVHVSYNENDNKKQELVIK
jgi:uncharacterized protein YcbK (DUF882 family)